MSKYHVGDRVVVVKNWPPNRAARQNPEGFMDQYLDTIVTIDCMDYGDLYRIKEDRHCWLWNDHCFAGLAVDISEPEFFNMLS